MDHRLNILKMLESGTITAAEAEALLEALEAEREVPDAETLRNECASLREECQALKEACEQARADCESIRSDCEALHGECEEFMEQAEEYGHSLDREVAFLTVHSMLHLLGYDHERSAEDDEAQCTAQRDIVEMLDF